MRFAWTRMLVPFAMVAGTAAAMVVAIGEKPETPAIPSPVRPEPTEHWLREEAEKENRIEREKWLESLHWAAPGTDWRAIEEANRAALRLERQSRIESGQRTDLWSEIGSANLAGRTHCAAVMPGTNDLYLGSDLGGVWKGTLDPQSWQPVSDALGKGSHGLLVVPGTPEVLITINNGGAVHASTNGGDTWFVPAGIPETTYEARRVLSDPGDLRTVYLLVRGKHWEVDHWQYGWFLCRSQDGGVSYQLVHNEPTVNPRCDLWISRTLPGPLWMMVGEQLFRSDDRGSTFQLMGAPSVNSDQVVFAGSEAGAPTLYAALKPGPDWQLYRTTDSGATWEMRYTITDFWETLVASITDPDLVFFAGVEAFRSTDGGATFAKVNNWYDYYDDVENKLHADLPGMECLLIDGQETFFFDTDGGTFVSTDGGVTVRNISLRGLGISQYYSTLTSTTNPYLVAAGAQDQGYQVSLPGQGTPYLTFTQAISGDYGHLTSTTRALDYVFSVYPGFVLVQRIEAPPYNLQQLQFPDGSTHGWMPFILADPTDNSKFYFCADYLWKYQRSQYNAYTQTRLSQSFAPDYASAIAIAPTDYNYWYVVNNRGKFWYSRNAGTSWTASSSTGPGAHYFYGTALIVHPANKNTVYAGGSGYSGPAVYRSTDGGANWAGFANGLPSTLVFGLVFDNATDQNLYAATEAGPYWYNASAGTWVSILGTEAPLTSYWCVESVPEIDAIRFGTYGRGIWDYQPQNPAGVGLAETQDGPEVRLFPNPATDRATIEVTTEAAGPMRVELFDVTGRKIRDLSLPHADAGTRRVALELQDGSARPLATGTYLVRVTAPGGTAVARVQVVGRGA